MKKSNKKITNKQLIINFFKKNRGTPVKSTEVAKKLKMTVKNLLSYLWCLEKRDDMLIYWIEAGKLVVKMV